ncbi:MAG TPA: flavodoxin domain-containing protein [Thermoleophilia bacterium]
MGPEVTRESAGYAPDVGPASTTALRILLVCATRHGSTVEVANAIAEELRAGGNVVDLRPAAEAPGPTGYDAVVVGGPMIMGWHREALRYLKKHRGELERLPTALFITAASLTENGESGVDGVPIVKDPWLAKAPGSAAKLTRKERYALPRHYLGDVLKKAAPLRPRSVAFFAGSLDLTTMNVLEKLFVLLVVGATPGDGRNWKAIREWGAGLGDVLRA